MLALALLAIFHMPGSASADSLCSVNEAPCSSKNLVPTKTKLQLGEAPFQLNHFLDRVTCNQATGTYQVGQNALEGGKWFPIVVENISESFSECASAIAGTCSSVAATGYVGASKMLASTATAGDGVVLPGPTGATGYEYTCAGNHCVYEFNSKSGTHVHTFTGGNPARERLEDEFTFVKGWGLCPGFVTAVAHRVFTSPTTLYWTQG